MKKIWERLSVLARYYFVSMICFFIFYSIFSLLKIHFLNTLFFMLAYIWHFALLTPGLKEKIFTKKQRFSFINVVVRVNHYLQLLIKIDKIPFGPSIIRAISPLLFTFILMVAGGNGNMIFTLLGSLCFEVAHYYLSPKSISIVRDDSEIPPAIPNVKNSPE